MTLNHNFKRLCEVTLIKKRIQSSASLVALGTFQVQE